MCSILAVLAHSCRLMASYAQGLSPHTFLPRLFWECGFCRRVYHIAMALFYLDCNFSHTVPIGLFPKGKRFRSVGVFRSGRFPVRADATTFLVGENVFRSVERFPDGPVFSLRGIIDASERYF